MKNKLLLIELWEFMRARKRYWLFPIVFILILLGAMIVFTESSVITPIIYALF